MADWHSAWKPAYDVIVENGPSPDRAVDLMLQFGEEMNLTTPTFYVSTALTSAGWRRLEKLRGPDGIPEAVERNNRTSSLILSQLVDNADSIVDESSMMVPTDLGKVPSWTDTDFLIFYFAWLGGLSANGASRFARSFNEVQYEQILDNANDRKVIDNAKRWPWYQLFTEVAVAKLRLAEAFPGSRLSDGASTLLQLVDVGESLGCRAERLYADARELDIIIPTFDGNLSGDLASDVRELRELGAVVGAQRTSVELIPLSLR